MRKIKIISNPYKKEIRYQDWNEKINDWEEITVQNQPNSKLISKEFIEGFFPFKVKKIIDCILEEFHSRNSNEQIEILFEGTEDEFNELNDLLLFEDYGKEINVKKSEKILENARDILPQIRLIFKENIYPLVEASVSDKKMVQNDLDKFSDASNEIIPVCVLGNYSAGKSTFINALIGREVLPSAERPTTAKIFKISQEKEDNKATVFFKFGNNDVFVKIMSESFEIKTDLNNQLIEDLNMVLSELQGKNIYQRLKETLEIVNEFERDDENGCISDLIQIEVPFQKGIWTETDNKFVIFDTPGSNSASNVNHFEVLKKAMEGLTNGIPIFVTKYDQLDTTDNEKLYEEINGMKELDSRFTMIVVNKADTSSLPKDGFSSRDRREILKQAVPKKMFSSGIYFVSAIMGLGFKNDGDFLDEHSAEIYEDNKEKYSNSNYRFYKTLYNYNIMPEQLKKNVVEEALKAEETILANSGLYSIEKEIQMFANKHAAYNKCEQSKKFLGNVIEITSEDIQKAKEQREETKKILLESLEKEKQLLLESLDEKGKEQDELYTQTYPEQLNKIVESSVFNYSDEQIRERDKEITEHYFLKYGYGKEQQDIKDAAGALATDLKENVSDFVAKFNIDSLKKIGKGLKDSIVDVADEIDQWKEVKLKSETEAGAFLIKELECDFNEHFNETKHLIENTSKGFWEYATKFIKEELGNLIAGAKELSEEKRKELSEIIIMYHDISFKNHSDEKFIKEHFEKKFTLLGETGKLNLIKLRWTYNMAMREDVNSVYMQISSEHLNEFKIWIYNLLNIIRDNIVDYSPELHEQSVKIQEETRKILDLEAKYGQLQNYSNKIKTMMDWKSR